MRIGILLIGMSIGIGADAADVDFPEIGSGEVQQALENAIDDLGLAASVDNGELAIALVTLEKNSFRALGMVNGHRMLYAASLPKIAILYGAAVAIDRDRLELTDDLHTDMNAMIRNSCNPCANRVLNGVGREWLLELLQSEPYRFYDKQHGGGLWLGKDYARAGAYQRDPLQGLSHAATVWQVARWYYLLQNGQLASPAQTELMLDALARPALNHKLVRGLSNRDYTALYRKSGTWRNYHADSILVVHPEFSYILVVLAKRADGEQVLQAIAPHMHDLVEDLSTAAGSSPEESARAH